MKPFFRTLLFTVIILLCVASFIGQLVNEKDDGGQKKIGLGIVGNTDDAILRFSLEFLENADEAKEYLDVVTVETELEAEEKVRSGEIAGCIIMTDDFLDSVRKGNNLELKFITKKTTVDLSSQVVHELLETVARMVVDIQAGAYTADTYLDNVPDYTEKKKWNKINAFFLQRVLSRDEPVEIVSVADDGISMGGYYTASAVVLFVTVIGIIYGSSILNKNRELHRLLDSSGCSIFWQILSETLSYVLSVLSLILLIMLALAVYFTDKTVGITELNGMNVVFALKLFVSLILPVSLLCVFQCAIYSLCKNLVSGLLLQFVLSVGLCYGSGCFYPSYFFPKAFIEIMESLPVGLSFSCIRSGLVGTVDIKSNLFCVLWIAFLVFVLNLHRLFTVKAGERL